MARPELPEAEKLNKTVSFRLTDGDYAAYRAKFEASGLTQSDFFRRHVLNNTTQVVAQSSEIVASVQRSVFLLSKASNNLNQLAHRANSAHQSGKVDRALFEAIQSQLEQLNDHMQAVAREAAKNGN
ncbi:plasmid mobilization protein [Azonexus sp. IMCC34839]|uniref:plasmid mobilization protein n=1 Tax=Azonexus sp. IMCC34839 TaxID=3133695 RepID=UPI003999D8CA